MSGPGFAPGRIALARRVLQRAVTPVIVQTIAVGCRVHQATLIKLALNLDKGLAEAFETGDIDRLIIGEGAAATVRCHDPAQDHRSISLDTHIVENIERDMPVGHLETCRDDRLFRPVSHQPAVRPGAERKAERIKQDGFTGTGFSGEYGKTRPETSDRACRSAPHRGS